ncbi:MAG TPA: ABC transporter ATP-binding protein [Candidatus Synoicihabitans sp.]|nr:ABC transporter ATP-binding protein [Candidatus Synoicihabitans sp.]
MLALTNLRKSFAAPDGGRSLIVDVGDWRLAPGQQVALRGASGTGKTTLLHLIAGILTPDTGSVSIDGVDVAALSEARRDRLRAEKIGYIFQTFNLLQGYSAIENVRLGAAFSRGRLDTEAAPRLLERVGLGDRVHHRPRQLSTGQQQRVAVARALVNRPRLVLADEPTGNLDRAHARRALALIRDVCREHEAALLLVSHDEDVLAEFDHVVDLSTINAAARADPTSCSP